MDHGLRVARVFWCLWVSGVEEVRAEEAILGVEPEKITTQKQGTACALGGLLRRITEYGPTPDLGFVVVGLFLFL